MDDVLEILRKKIFELKHIGFSDEYIVENSLCLINDIIRNMNHNDRNIFFKSLKRELKIKEICNE